MNRQPIIYLTPEVHRQMGLYTGLAKGEISWLGSVERFGAHDFLVTQIYLIKQETTTVKTKFDDDAMAEFLMALHTTGKDIGQLKLWLHTHYNFATSWSERDEKTIDSFSRSGFLLSIVTNTVGDILARIDVFDPVRLTLHGVRVIVLEQEYSDEELKAAAAEIEAKVTFTVPPPVKVIRYLDSTSNAMEEEEVEWPPEI